MQILAIRHVPFEGLGYLGPVLDDHQIEYQYADLYASLPSVPTMERFGALVVLGGPMSANDNLPSLREELRLIETALDSGIPILGICLGAQLIAKALGARVGRNKQDEIGWFPVYWKEAARTDALFGGLSNPVMTFHWHSETFDLPAGAVWLASSEACSYQAYRVRRNVYGMQFHPEVGAEMIADWCRQEVNCGDVGGLKEPIDPHAHDQENLARTVFSRWAGTVLAGSGGDLPAEVGAEKAPRAVE